MRRLRRTQPTTRRQLRPEFSTAKLPKRRRIWHPHCSLPPPPPSHMHRHIHAPGVNRPTIQLIQSLGSPSPKAETQGHVHGQHAHRHTHAPGVSRRTIQLIKSLGSSPRQRLKRRVTCTGSTRKKHRIAAPTQGSLS